VALGSRVRRRPVRRLLLIELHAPDPVCRVTPDWIVRQEEGVWMSEDRSGKWPMRPPWWHTPRAPEPDLRGIIHLLICHGGEGPLPSGPAEVAGALVAELMAAYSAAHPHPHHARGPIYTPDGHQKARSALPPLCCPPWEWCPHAEDARHARSAELRADLTPRWLVQAWGGGG
jgi:hypothetical protein